MKQHILITLAAISLCLTGCSKKDDKDPSFMFWNFRKEVVSGFYHVPDMNSEEIATYLRDRVKTIRGYVDSSADLSSNTLT
ncbi:MAG: hypothetical protein OES84_04610, partial [Kiritimatiellaceae bacterium]|nr:hypothetical protein [Kiritimatiellaceae bacterium]